LTKLNELVKLQPNKMPLKNAIFDDVQSGKEKINIFEK